MALYEAVPNRRRAIFLDRDGVLNAAIVVDGQPFSPVSLAEMRLLPGVEEACAELKSSGFLLIVITNQPDIARGKISAGEVDEINAVLKARLAVDEICVCPHDDADACECRKPKPGLLIAAAQRWNIDLASSFMVGDRWRDIEAGHAAGCLTVFVDYGYSERRPDVPDIVTGSLLAAVPNLIATSRKEVL